MYCDRNQLHNPIYRKELSSDVALLSIFIKNKIEEVALLSKELMVARDANIFLALLESIVANDAMFDMMVDILNMHTTQSHKLLNTLKELRDIHKCSPNALDNITGLLYPSSSELLIFAACLLEVIVLFCEKLKVEDTPSMLAHLDVHFDDIVLSMLHTNSL